MDRSRSKYFDYARRCNRNNNNIPNDYFVRAHDTFGNVGLTENRQYNDMNTKKYFYRQRTKSNLNHDNSISDSRVQSDTGSASMLTKRNVTNYDCKNDEASANIADKFCIDRIGRSVSDTLTSSADLWDIPRFSQKYKFALPETEDMAGLALPNRSKPRSFCFNCSQDDHKLDSCPYPLNHEMIRRNKQQFHAKSAEAVEQQRIHARYHIDGNEVTVPRFAHFKPGKFTDNLRKALELNDDQLPVFIYRMRVLGYPPGWLNEAAVLRSQVGMKAEDYEEGEISEDKVEYDFDRIIAFPGFNSPLPENCVDEYDLHGVPRYSVEHNIKLFLQSLGSRLEKKSLIRKNENANKIDFVEAGVEEMDVTDEEDISVNQNSKETYPGNPVLDETNTETAMKDGTADHNPQLKNNTSSVSDLSELSLLTENFLSSTTLPRSGESILEQDGTPLFLPEDRIDVRIPDQAQFACGINEHRFFENLPGSVGNFKKIIELVKK